MPALYISAKFAWKEANPFLHLWHPHNLMNIWSTNDLIWPPWTWLCRDAQQLCPLPGHQGPRLGAAGGSRKWEETPTSGGAWGYEAFSLRWQWQDQGNVRISAELALPIPHGVRRISHKKQDTQTLSGVPGLWNTTGVLSGTGRPSLLTSPAQEAVESNEVTSQPPPTQTNPVASAAPCRTCLQAPSPALAPFSGPWYPLEIVGPNLQDCIPVPCPLPVWELVAISTAAAYYFRVC